MLPPGFYCERLTPDLLGEPLNALSNLGFLAAALLAWRRSAALAGGEPELVRSLRLLSGLLALVGLGSLSFHTLATGTTQVLDVAFIGLFNVAYLACFGRQALGWTRAASAAAVAGFVLVDQLRAAWLPAALLHGSALYLPPLAVLLLLAALAARHAPAAARSMALAALVFAVSLTARTLDQPLCRDWPAGLHFVWHLLNAWVLLQLIRAFAQAARMRLAIAPAAGGGAVG